MKKDTIWILIITIFVVGLLNLLFYYYRGVDSARPFIDSSRTGTTTAKIPDESAWKNYSTPISNQIKFSYTGFLGMFLNMDEVSKGTAIKLYVNGIEVPEGEHLTFPDPGRIKIQVEVNNGSIKVAHDYTINIVDDKELGWPDCSCA